MTLVVAAIMEREGRMLIGQRRRDGPHPLKWEFPGGKVEAGESAECALVRELQEELGVQAVVGEEITRFPYQYPLRPLLELVFYRIASFDGEPRNLAFERIAWVETARLAEYDFLDGDVEFVRTVWSSNGIDDEDLLGSKI